LFSFYLIVCITSVFIVVIKEGVNGWLKLDKQSHISPLNNTLNRSLKDNFQQEITSPEGSLKAGKGLYPG